MALIVGLVGCGDRKVPHSARAKDMYTSTYFLHKRTWAENNCDEWWIVSGRYGLLAPDQGIPTYNERVNPLTRDLFLKKVWRQLSDAYRGSPALHHFVMLVSPNYLELPATYTDQHWPRLGKGIGNQMA